MGAVVTRGNEDIFKGATEAFGVDRWDKYPIAVGGEEKLTLSIPSDGKTVLLGRGLSPCEIVGIGPNDSERASPELLKLDRIFRKAVGDYARAGAIAAGKDRGVIIRINNESTWATSVTDYVIDILLWFSGKIPAERIGSRHITNEGSTHRRAWLHSVNTLEQKRMEATREQIRARCEVLVSKINDLRRQDEMDMKLVNELDQLERVYAVYFPGCALQVGQVAVSVLVRQINSTVGI